MARQPRKSAKETKPPPVDDLRQRVIAAAFDLAARQGWETVSLTDIAHAADTRLSELYGLFPSKRAILEGFTRDVDAKVLGGLTAPDTEESPRDRLFDVLMRRFDALEPHRAGVEAVLRASPRDPLNALCGLASLIRSMAWMLEAAGIPAAGPRGVIRAKALALLYLTVLRTWLSDESPDKARTMAALDERLRRAGRWIGATGQRRAAAAE